MTTGSAVRLDPEQTIPDLQAVLEHAIETDPRTLQTTIGPSSLGSACDRCLIIELAGLKEPKPGARWPATIGKAVHDWVEGAVIRHLMATGSDRYIPEGRVLVGSVAGVEIWGSSDLLDIWTGTVVDYKLVGTTSLRDARQNGPKTTYRRQVHLYGKGWADKGFDVRSVAVWFLPRNGLTIDRAFLWQQPFDYADAEETLKRANAFAAGISAFGLEAVLASAPAHTGKEFGCPDPRADARSAEQLNGLLIHAPDADDNRAGPSAA